MNPSIVRVCNENNCHLELDTSKRDHVISCPSYEIAKIVSRSMQEANINTSAIYPEDNGTFTLFSRY